MSTALPFRPTPALATRLLVVVLAVQPFQSIYWQHFSRGPEATGFIQYDMPYYAANGREIFERGNGLAYPNPYDPDPLAPTIYFQWFTWMLGAGIKLLGLDPGLLFVAIGLIAGLACSWLTLKLVEATLPDTSHSLLLFLLAMWGGGILCLGRVALNVLSLKPPLADLFADDPTAGWWFLNWGRNLVLPTEAVYHAIVAATWLAALRNRWNLMLVGAGALAATHPFSGLQHLLIVGCWLGWLAWQERSPNAVRRLAVAAGIMVAFLGYYFVFLGSFEQHRLLQKVWSQNRTMTVPAQTLLLAYGPVGLIATLQLKRRAWKLDQQSIFLLMSFVVSLLLVKHDWFVSPRQPAHFTRGYVWMPLFLLALPQLQRWLGLSRMAWRRPVRTLILVICGIIAVFDNSAFVVRIWRSGEQQFWLSRDQRQMFAWADQQQLRGVLLCADSRLSYLAATYTSLDPYYGHRFNTPQMQRRGYDVAAWQQLGESGAWLATIDYLLLSASDPPRGFQAANWQLVHEEGEWRLYRHVSRDRY